MYLFISVDSAPANEQRLFRGHSCGQQSRASGVEASRPPRQNAAVFPSPSSSTCIATHNLSTVATKTEARDMAACVCYRTQDLQALRRLSFAAFEDTWITECTENALSTYAS